MRLIDADELYKKVTEKYRDIVAGSYPYNVVAFDLAEMVKDAPTVEPVRGEWIYERGTYSVCSAWKCSNCGKSYGLPFIKDEYNFCPNCGCRMKD